ncbi:MAG: hypothetical protein U0892_10355 [Pirellulales bacterium]
MHCAFQAAVVALYASIRHASRQVGFREQIAYDGNRQVTGKEEPE